MQLIPKNMTDDLLTSLELARKEAARRHTPYVDTEHLLLGLLGNDTGSMPRFLSAKGTAPGDLYDHVADQLGMARAELIMLRGVSRDAQDALTRAATQAQAMGHTAIDSGHLLLSLLGSNNTLVKEALAQADLEPDLLREYLDARTLRPSGGAIESPLLALMGVNKAKASGPGTPLRGGRATRRKQEQRPVIVIRRGVSQDDSRRNLRLILIALGLLVVYLLAVLPFNVTFTFIFVLVGWVFSLTLHEFSHALVAYWGGDYTVKDKGYLTFNPLKYTHPALSIFMPLLFLALGGIGLPGGAVYIERHRLRSEWWGAAVSAAGPASNFLFAVLLAIPFVTGLVDTDVIANNLAFAENREDIMARNPNMSEDDFRAIFGVEEDSIWENSTLWSAWALLIMLQVTAVIFNLIPVPPLDGFGIVEPFLDQRTRMQMLQIGSLGLLLVIFALWFIDPLNHAFWDFIYGVTDGLNISRYVIEVALFERFMFWR